VSSGVAPELDDEVAETVDDTGVLLEVGVWVPRTRFGGLSLEPSAVFGELYAPRAKQFP